MDMKSWIFCYTRISPCENQHTFQRNITPPSSGLKSKPSRDQDKTSTKQRTAQHKWAVS
jgi:hypothetical protein